MFSTNWNVDVQHVISAYAGLDAQRLGADIRFVSVLSELTPVTGLGKMYTSGTQPWPE